MALGIPKARSVWDSLLFDARTARPGVRATREEEEGVFTRVGTCEGATRELDDPRQEREDKRRYMLVAFGDRSIREIPEKQPN